MSTRNTVRLWLYAVKPASWPKTLVPCFLGQAAGAVAAGGVAGAPLLVGVLFTAANTGFIVLLNDWGDRRVDALKRRLFPEGSSPKTIPDGILPAGAVLRGGLAAGAAALSIALLGEWGLGRPGLTLGAIVALSLFLAYTFPPLRLNYRGGGELLEALGIGAVLPILNAWLQGGPGVASPELWSWLAAGVLAGYLPMSLGSAVASGLSDEVSDRRGGKRTITTAFGNPRARALVGQAMVAGVAGWAAVGLGAVAAALVDRPGASGSTSASTAPLGPTLVGVGVACLIAAGLAARLLPPVFRASPAAVTNAFAAQGTYKAALHRATWRSGTVLAILWLWTALALR